MRTVTLGASRVAASCIGLGCMGMSEFYGHQDEAESLRTLDRALELGVTLYDTADIYGRGQNERLVGRFAKGRRDRMVITTKFGVVRDPDGPPGSTYDRDLNNAPDYMRRCLDASLERLGTDRVDLYYIHRLDGRTPIEEIIAALGEEVARGRISGIGLSEVDAATLRRAHAVHPISALQSEYSLFVRDVEGEILPACRKLGIAFVPYSPLGRGVLTGAITSKTMLDKDDLRNVAPMFQDGAMDQNLALLDRIRTLAAAKEATLGQIALAWLLARGDDILPIPGTKRIKYLEENVGAAQLDLTPDELARIDETVAPDKIAGARWSTVRS